MMSAFAPVVRVGSSVDVRRMSANCRPHALQQNLTWEKAFQSDLCSDRMLLQK
jgi:hypothetical protein